MADELTREELQAKLAVAEQAELQECLKALQSLAAERGFVVIAIPQIAADGRLTAQWGVRRAQG